MELSWKHIQCMREAIHDPQRRLEFEESVRVAQQYQERFGHPPQPYYRPVNPISRLTREQRFHLVTDALEKNEPVPGWAEAEETQNKVRATNGAIV